MQTTAFKGFRLSLQQSRLWTLQGESHDYRYQCSILLEGLLDIAALQDAIQLLLKRHAILRTVFICPAGMDLPMQVVATHADLAVETIALTHLSPQEQEVYCAGQFEKWLYGSFDLEQGPLLRLRLWRLAEQRHLLFCALPALCADLSTMRLLISELATLYSACLNHQTPGEEPLQYADVSAWQRKLLSSDDVRDQKDYWRHQITEPVDVHLPFQRNQSDNSSQVGALYTHDVRLEASLRERLRLYAKREAVSPESCLLTAWTILLWRLTEECERTIGLARNGRFYEDLECALGLFTRYLPVRTSLDQGASWHRLVYTMHAILEEMDELQYYFSWESTELSTPENRPLAFPLAFSYEEWPLVKDDQLTWSLQQWSGCQEPLALHLQTIETGEKILLRFSSDAAQIDTGQASMLPDLFLTLLESALQQPHIEIRHLAILKEEKYQSVFRPLIGIHASTPPVPFHRLFEMRAHERPQQLAVICGDRQITYGELNSEANVLANVLQGHGVRPGTLVAICVERSVEMIIGLLAILKSGGTYVPVEPDQPEERIAYILRDSEAPLLLTQPHLIDRIPDVETQVIYIQADREKGVAANGASLSTEIDLNALAYVIYTSGSTGVPKGVAIRHASVVNYAHHIAQWVVEGDGLHFATVSTLSADLGNTSIFSALITGGCLHVIPYEVLTCGEQFALYAREHPLDVLKIVPSHLQALLTSCPAELKRYLLPRHSLICGGETLHWNLLNQLAALEAQCRVFNHYGPTETTVGVLIYPLGIPTTEHIHHMKQDAVTVPVGRPIANVAVYVLDSSGNAVPPGVVGELWISGAALSAGYLHRDDLTSQRFLPLPRDTSKGICYRTGDLVRITPLGHIEFMGRVDRQVKLRGFRIELDEVESVLGEYPGVWEHAVMMREDRAGEPQLVAYVVARQQHTPTSQDLHAFILKRLPTYMVPGAFVFLRQLPLTRNGKVDWHALPAPEPPASEQQLAVGSQTPTQELLASIWQDVLKVRQVTIHTQFAELGGHSLLATQVVSRIRAIFGVEIPLRSMFETPTVAALAERVDQMMQYDSQLGSQAITHDPSRQDEPLSFAQQRLWFLYQLDPGSTAYIHPVVTRMTGEVNIAALEYALREVAVRHAVLRTTFPVKNGQPVQHINPVRPSYLQCIDLRDQPEYMREALVTQLAEEEAGLAFDFVYGPLWRVKLLLLDAQKYVLSITFHHITTDGWSNSIFIRELTTLYNAYMEGHSARLPELPVQYIDFSAWQRQWLEGELLFVQLEYWRKQLKDAAPLQLPTDRPRPAMQTFHGSRQGHALSPPLSDALKKLSQREGVTLFMTLLAAFQVLLYRYAAQDDIIVGTPIANRNRSEIEGLIGFFVNTLVMRTNLRGNPTFKSLLGRVREMAFGAYAHQDLPFEKLTEELQPERDLSRTPFFQVMFLLQNMSLPIGEFSGIQLEPISREAQTAKFDLTMMLVDTPEGLMSGLEYNTDLFDASTIERMLSHWQILLEALVASPDQHIDDLPLLRPDEYEQIVYGWNDTQVVFPKEMCVHQQFEAQVASTPSAIALICGEESMTYAELNMRANHVARHLQRLGVRPGDLVALYMDRRTELVVCLLGILKAGAAYVPLDPAYPTERLIFMLEDTQAPIVLTREHMLPALASFASHCVTMEQISPALEGKNISSSVSSADLAYLIYTSGSTGRPKGVAITHKNCVALLSWLRATFTPDQLTGVLASTSICFDLSIFELFGPLSCGGTSILVDTILSLLEWSDVHPAITLINTVPSALSEVLRAGQLPPTVQVVNLAGEPVSAHLVSQLYAHESITHVYDLYGPSEDTTYSTCYLARRDTEQPPYIGRPLYNTFVYILDKNLSPVPLGVIGELYISGERCAREYFRRPDLTAEKFIPEPFTGRLGARMYGTGDLARYLPDGTIEFLGRIDNQVKIRGFRIEPGEIEHSLAGYPAVQECVIIVHGESLEEKQLVAYVVPKVGSELSSLAIRAYLKERLPEYLVPSRYVIVDSLPLLANGKIDRKRLVALYTQEGTHTYVAPRSELELQVMQIWRETLGNCSLGITDNFFEIGGHSLLAVRLVSLLRQHFEADFALSLLFHYPTVEAMARVIGQQIEVEEFSSILVPIRATGTRTAFFCVHPAGGTVFCYHALAQHLSPKQPFYGLQTPDLDGTGTSFASLEDMASHYIEAIRAVQPEGPYALGGWSLGGVVAFEMARQLSSAGQHIALLALFDSGVPVGFFDPERQAECYDLDDETLVRYLIERNAIVLPDEAFYSRSSEDQLASILQQGKQASLIPENTDLAAFRRLERIHYTNEFLVRAYRPTSYSGKITLFRASEDLPEHQSATGPAKPASITRSLTRGWDLLTDSLEVHTVGGTHANIVEEPHVRNVATLLDLCLARTNAISDE